VFTSRCNRAKVMVTMRKQCARARDVHESGKTSKAGCHVKKLRGIFLDCEQRLTEAV
jgi:hypothetical protein